MLSSKARESSSVAGKGRTGGLPDELQALIKSSGGTISQMKRLRSDGTWEDLMSDRDKKAAADREGKKKDDLLVMSCHRTRAAVYLPLSLLLPYSHICPPVGPGGGPIGGLQRRDAHHHRQEASHHHGHSKPAAIWKVW